MSGFKFLIDQGIDVDLTSTIMKEEVNSIKVFAAQGDRQQQNGDRCSRDDSMLPTRYHGSGRDFAYLRAGTCTTTDIDYAAKYARGEIGGSKSYRCQTGWIYVLKVPDDLLSGEKLLKDTVPVKRIPVKEHKSDPIEGLLPASN